MEWEWGMGGGEWEEGGGEACRKFGVGEILDGEELPGGKDLKENDI